MSSKSISPNHREILSARSTITGLQEYLVSTSGALNVTGTVIVVPGTTSIGDGRKTVASGGTAEALASSTSAQWVVVTAETDNTGVVVVGGSSVVASLSTRQGTPLYAGDSATLICDNLGDVYLDVTVNGEGVTFTYGA